VEETASVGRIKQAATNAEESYPGYIHYAEKSSFDPTSTADLPLPLTTPAAVRSYVEFGFERVEGPRGISSHNPQTGFSGATPSAEVLGVVKPYGATIEEHHAKVREYFAASGLPADQMGSVTGGEQMDEQGTVSDPGWKTRLVAYTSLVTRSILGIPIHGSGAFASLADSGRAISETVFWPAIPAGPVKEAAAWKAALAGDAVAAFRSRLPSDIKWSETNAFVAVVHQSMRWTGAPYARAVYHVSTGAKLYRFLPDGREFKTPEDP
jgi:hypothetical protein